MYLAYLEKKICFHHFDGNREVKKMPPNENQRYLFVFIYTQLQVQLLLRSKYFENIFKNTIKTPFIHQAPRL